MVRRNGLSYVVELEGIVSGALSGLSSLLKTGAVPPVSVRISRLTRCIQREAFRNKDTNTPRGDRMSGHDEPSQQAAKQEQYSHQQE